MIDLVKSDYLAETEECSYLFRVEDGMYFIQYSGSNINSSSHTFTPRKFSQNLIYEQSMKFLQKFITAW